MRLENECVNLFYVAISNKQNKKNHLIIDGR